MDGRHAVASELERVTVMRAGSRVLDQVIASIPAAGITVVSGPSGAGKMTLLRLLVGAALARIISPHPGAEARTARRFGRRRSAPPAPTGPTPAGSRQATRTADRAQPREPGTGEPGSQNLYSRCAGMGISSAGIGQRPRCWAGQTAMWRV